MNVVCVPVGKINWCVCIYTLFKKKTHGFQYNKHSDLCPLVPLHALEMSSQFYEICMQFKTKCFK